MNHTPPAANDNGVARIDATLLGEALRLFARHGMAAAGEARDASRRATLIGDQARAERWLAICSALDRRLAADEVAAVEDDDRRAG